MLVRRTARTMVRSLAVPAWPERVIAVTYPPPLLSTISISAGFMAAQPPSRR